ncbi:alpha-amylase family glycosyl hydrolase [Halobacillus mangrovi]|uniref:alpha-amylase family glycosyl hydrolase n=1 Tax=Halobacillus mangrovi TaxID=402384 RepID=UPI003D9963F6
MRKSIIVLMVPLLFLYALPVGAVEKEGRKWQDESIYYVMVDRFMNGSVENNENVDTSNPEAYHGGDIQGVIDQLDHIKELGFTTIELSPIMANSEKGYHGYWIEDFRKVEEHFGSVEDVKRLIEEAHKRDMKVMLDLVIGHTSPEHPWLEDQSKTDWFKDGAEENQNPWLEKTRALNTSNPDVQQYLIETAQFWKNQTGVDAFKLFDASSVSPEFIQTLMDEVALENENFFIAADSSAEVSGRIDTALNESIREVFASSGRSLDNLYDIWEENRDKYSNSDQLLHYMDSPVVPRFTHLAVEEGLNPITRWELALTYLFTSPGIPVLYFGSEVPLDDGGDPSSIPMMNFKAEDEELKRRIEKLTSMRDQFPALTRGDFVEMYNKDGLAVFKRTYQEQTMIIAINNAKETKSTELTSLEDDQQLTGLIQDGIIRQQKDGVYRLGMERETADVFLVEQDRGYNWLFIGFVGGVLSLFVIAVIAISLKNRKTNQS